MRGGANDELRELRQITERIAADINKLADKTKA